MASEFKWKIENKVWNEQSVGVYMFRDRIKIEIFSKWYNSILYMRINDIHDKGCDRKARSVEIIVGDILAI
jgi:hypothetical protein